MKKRVEVPFKIISTEQLLVTSGIHEWSEILLNFRALTESKLREINILPVGEDFEEGEPQRTPEQASKKEKHYIEALVNTGKNAADYEEIMMNLLHEDRAQFNQTSKIVDLAINTIICALDASGHIEDETYSEKQRNNATNKYLEAFNETKKQGYKLLSLTDEKGHNPSYSEVAFHLLDQFYKDTKKYKNNVPDEKLIIKWLKDEVPINHNPKLGSKSKDYIDFFKRVEAT
tara:strand:+ start:405 stop:1097 length:693 start_codon:yes stop_codon:yes gene_type:complete